MVDVGRGRKTSIWYGRSGRERKTSMICGRSSRRGA